MIALTTQPNVNVEGTPVPFPACGADRTGQEQHPRPTVVIQEKLRALEVAYGADGAVFKGKLLQRHERIAGYSPIETVIEVNRARPGSVPVMRPEKSLTMAKKRPRPGSCQT